MAKLEIEEVTGTKVRELNTGDVFRWEGDYYMHTDLDSEKDDTIIAIDLSTGQHEEFENEVEVDVVKARLEVKVED